MRRRVKIAVAASVFASILSVHTAGAQQSQLQQQIKAPDCSIPAACVVRAPTIMSINERGGRPFIIGTYDAAFTKSLRVTLGGRVYIPGQDEELTVKDDQWWLDLRTLQAPLVSGTYELAVEVIGYDEETKKSDSNFTLTPQEVARTPVYPKKVTNPEEKSSSANPPPKEPDTTSPPADDELKIPQPLHPSPNIFTKAAPIIVVPVAAIGGYGAFLAVRRYRRNNKDGVL